MEVNPFYEKTVNYMASQISYLEELLNRELTQFELENIKEYYKLLDPKIKDKFESKFEPLI